MQNTMLKLHPEKTELLLVGSQLNIKIDFPSPLVTQFPENIRNFCVVFDADHNLLV